jgi:hypothetical protein
MINETEETTETNNILKALLRPVNETVSLTENVARFKLIIRYINETLSIPETFTVRRVMVKYINETVGLVENIARKSQLGIQQITNPVRGFARGLVSKGRATGKIVKIFKRGHQVKT